MSGVNSRRDLRLRLEGCSTGEEQEQESEDETNNPSDRVAFDAFAISVILFCWKAIDVNVYTHATVTLVYRANCELHSAIFMLRFSGHKNPRCCRVVRERN